MGKRQIIRIIQRYLVPHLLKSAIFFLRDHCMVSGRASVQLTSNIRFGRGTVVKPFAVIQSNGGRIIVEKFCSINNFVQIAAYRADVVLGDYVRIGPNVTILGGRRRYRARNVR